MLLVSYDISNDRTRRHFSEFLSKYGYRLQYSVFHIRNSDRVLKIIKLEIENRFRKRFHESDSVMIFDVDEKTVVSYGYAFHEDDSLIIVE